MNKGIERWLVFSLPLAAIMLALVFQYSDLDLKLAYPYFDQAHGVWPLRDHWLTQTVLHTSVQFMAKVFGVLLLGFTAYLYSFRKRPQLRVVLACVWLSMATGIGIVGYLKSHTRIYCPWDLQVFGGQLPHVPFFESLSLSTPIGHAFPAAHAAVGFAFVSVYFSCALFVPKWKYTALGLALGMGFLLGFVQQLRGAHFMSHDLFSLAICWVAALGVHTIFFREQMSLFLWGPGSDKVRYEPQLMSSGVLNESDH